jgi:hypothetical protein
VTACGLHRVDAPRQREFSWPSARRYLIARVLRAPVRHLASVTRERDRFRASCICGWDSGWHPHQGAAFSDAHVHTRYVQTVIFEPDALRE